MASGRSAGRIEHQIRRVCGVLSCFSMVWGIQMIFGGLADCADSKIFRLFLCVEVALPGNLFTVISSWEANPVYLHQIFTRLTPTTLVSHAKLPTPEPSLFGKQERLCCFFFFF